MRPTHIAEDNLLHWVADSNTSLMQKHPHRHTEVMFNLDTLWPVKATQNEPSQLGTLSRGNSLSEDVSQQSVSLAYG